MNKKIYFNQVILEKDQIKTVDELVKHKEKSVICYFGKTMYVRPIAFILHIPTIQVIQMVAKGMWIRKKVK